PVPDRRPLHSGAGRPAGSVPGPGRPARARRPDHLDHAVQARGAVGSAGLHQERTVAMAVQPMTGPSIAARGGDTPALAVDALEVSYGSGAPVLTGLTLRVPPGSAVALLGPNGAGKTTTIRAISGLMKMHSGQ